MSYLKLCQIINQSPSEIFYQEDSYGAVIVDKIQSYPVTFEIEVIDWVDEEQYIINGNINNFYIESVVLNIPTNLESSSIRKFIFNELVNKYPNLII